jgi:hypothetical protein
LALLIISRITDTPDALHRTIVTSQSPDYTEAEMTRYFFHLRSEENFVWDDEGVDLPDPLTAQGAADKTAAELRGGLLHQVRHDSCWTVAVTDESGEIIHTVAL